MSVPKHIYVYCKECEKVVEKYVPETCEHVAGVRLGRSAAPLTTYFEAPDGSVSIPGKEGAKLPARLAKLGYVEKTISNGHEYSQFCKRMDKAAYAKHEQYMEALHQQYSEAEKVRREEIRGALKTQLGKDFFNEAVRQAEREQYSQGHYSAGSHLEGYEYNSKRGREE